MKLLKGMVFQNPKVDDVYNEIVDFQTCGKKKVVVVSQFGPFMDDQEVNFFESEFQYCIRKSIAVLVNNWASKN